MPQGQKKDSIWDHFTTFNTESFKGKRSRCNHCRRDYALNATQQAAHLKSCEQYVEYMLNNGQNSDILQAALDTRKKQPAPTPTKRGRPPNQPADISHSSDVPTPASEPVYTIIDNDSNTKKRAAEGSAQSPNGTKRPTMVGKSVTPRASQMAFRSASKPPTSTTPKGTMMLSYDGNSRYTESFYWARFPGNENECREILLGPPPPDLRCNIDNDSALEMAQNLKNLPTKPIADTLLYSFFTSVHPVVPIVSPQQFRVQYNKLWEWCGDAANAHPHEVLRKDITFIGVFWAVLYAGAVAASSSFWKMPLLKSISQDKLISQLKQAYQVAIEWCNSNPSHPTENTLTASLLVHSVSIRWTTRVESLGFIAQAVREARLLGLHQAIKLAGSNKDAYDRRRRLWFQLVTLDVQTAKLHGVAPVYGDLHPTFQDEMVAELLNRDPSVSDVANIEPPMALSLCQFESSRIKNFIIQSSASQNGRSSDFDFANEQIRRLRVAIDNIIANIPAKGVPEEGFISARIANAKQLVDKDLFKESNGKEPTVFGSWTRIMLTTIKNDLDITFHKARLNRNGLDKSDELHDIWEILARSCIAYLRLYAEMMKTASFATYRWYNVQQPPLEPTICLLKYLAFTRLSKSPEMQLAQLARYLVDEMLDLASSQLFEATISSQNLVQAEFNRAWQYLKQLKDDLEEESRNSNMVNTTIDVDALERQAQSSGSTIQGL